MGRFRNQGNRKRKAGPAHGRDDPDYFGNPKFPRGHNHGPGVGKEKGESPLLQHFLFWVVVLLSFGSIFGFFQSQIVAVELWNDVFTLFGAISYTAAFIGWMVTIIVAMCVDMILVS